MWVTFHNSLAKIKVNHLKMPSTKKKSATVKRSPRCKEGKRAPSEWNLAVKKSYAELKKTGGAKWNEIPPTERMVLAIKRAKKALGK